MARLAKSHCLARFLPVNNVVFMETLSRFTEHTLLAFRLHPVRIAVSCYRFITVAPLG